MLVAPSMATVAQPTVAGSGFGITFHIIIGVVAPQGVANDNITAIIVDDSNFTGRWCIIRQDVVFTAAAGHESN